MTSSGLGHINHQFCQPIMALPVDVSRVLRRSDQETLNDYDLIIKEQTEAGVIELVKQHMDPSRQTTPASSYGQATRKTSSYSVRRNS